MDTDNLRTHYSATVMKKVPFIFGLALVFPFLFLILYNGFIFLFGSIQESGTDLSINHYSNEWMNHILLPGEGIPFSEMVGTNLSLYDLGDFQTPLVGIMVSVLSIIVSIVLTAGFLGSWRQVFEGRYPTLKTFKNDVIAFAPGLFIQMILIGIIVAFAGLVASFLFMEIPIVMSLFVAFIMFIFITAPFHIVFHDVDAAESIKISIQYVFKKLDVMIAFVFMYLLASLGLYLVRAIFNSYSPLIEWLYLAFVGSWLIGALAAYIWEHELNVKDGEILFSNKHEFNDLHGREESRASWRANALLIVGLIFCIPIFNGVGGYYIAHLSEPVISGKAVMYDTYQLGQTYPNERDMDDMSAAQLSILTSKEKEAHRDHTTFGGEGGYERMIGYGTLESSLTTARFKYEVTNQHNNYYDERSAKESIYMSLTNGSVKAFNLLGLPVDKNIHLVLHSDMNHVFVAIEDGDTSSRLIPYFNESFVTRGGTVVGRHWDAFYDPVLLISEKGYAFPIPESIRYRPFHFYHVDGKSETVRDVVLLFNETIFVENTSYDFWHWESLVWRVFYTQDSQLLQRLLETTQWSTAEKESMYALLKPYVIGVEGELRETSSHNYLNFEETAYTFRMELHYSTGGQIVINGKAVRVEDDPEANEYDQWILDSFSVSEEK